MADDDREKRRKKRRNRNKRIQKKRLAKIKGYGKTAGEMDDDEFARAIMETARWAERRYRVNKKRRKPQRRTYGPRKPRKDKGKGRGGLKSVVELREEAKRKGIRGYSKMKKEQLLRKIALYNQKHQK